MYSADGIGRGGHRLLALTLFGLGAIGLVLTYSQIQPVTGWMLWTGLVAVAAALLFLTASLFVAHRARSAPQSKPRAAAVPTPPLEVTEAPLPDPGNVLIDYDEADHAMPFMDHTPDHGFQGTVPRATVVDERPPAPPIPEVVQTRHDFRDKYTQSTPQVRQILQDTAPPRPQHVMADLADPGMHPSQLPPRTMRGKCGGCDTLILAPTQRPLELECPSCARVTLLE